MLWLPYCNAVILLTLALPSEEIEHENQTLTTDLYRLIKKYEQTRAIIRELKVSTIITLLYSQSAITLKEAYFAISNGNIQKSQARWFVGSFQSKIGWLT